MKKGILFWITGLSGSGKTTLAKKIFPEIKKKYGPTILLDGDKCRKIMDLYGFTYEDRLSNSKKYIKLAKLLTDQNINVIFSLVCLMEKPRTWNRKNISNYLEIYIKTDINKIILKRKKKIYKNDKNVVGISINPEFPKKPHIILRNNFKKDINACSADLMIKIKEHFN